jgi:DNA mismatch repair protein MutS
VLDRLRGESAIEATGSSGEQSESVQAAFDLGSGQFAASGGPETATASVFVQ